MIKCDRCQINWGDADVSLPSQLYEWGDAIHLCVPCLWKFRRAFKIFMLTPDEHSAIKADNE